MLSKYFTKEIDLQCLLYCNIQCNITAEEAAEKLIRILLATPIESINNILKDASEREAVTAENIPQFSDIAIALFHVPTVLADQNRPLSYEEMGQLILGGDKNATADKKYGENHGKLAALLDLAIISKDSNSATISSSVLGKQFAKLTNDEQFDIASKLVYRIPIIQNAILCTDANESIESDLSILAPSTRARRISNVRELLALAKQE